MTKTLNQIIFFFLHQNRIFFSATLGIRIFFLEKTITPPLEVKWPVPNIYIYGVGSNPVEGRTKKKLTALKSNSNTVWFNFQTYIV